MSAQEFITNYIKDFLPYELTTEDKKIIEFEGISEYIYRKFTSSKFRASKVDDVYNKVLKTNIAYCVENEIPIIVNYGFGGTKNPHTPYAPHIDWAEVFNVFFLREYLKPIAAAYNPGVVLEYFSVALFQEFVNFIPQEDTNTYEKEFKALVEFANNFYPKNLAVKYSSLEDTHDKQEIIEFMKKDVERRRKEWDKQSQDVIDTKLMRAERNAKINSDEPDFMEKRLHSALAHDAFGPEEWATIPVKWNNPDVIALGNNYTEGWAIRVKSAPGSIINFWAGTGILEKKGNSFLPKTLSSKQYSELLLADQKIMHVPLNMFDKGLAILNKIPVLS